jgi:hypothetical protein
VAESTLNAGQVERWQFEAQAGDAIRLNALGAVTLRLLNPEGSEIAVGTPLELTLPLTGRYTVEVQLAAGESGRYQLGLAYTDRPDPASFTATPPPLSVGVPTPTPFFTDQGIFIQALEAGREVIETFLPGPVQPHVYTFSGQAGDYVTIQAALISGTLDPLLWLYDPAGAALAVDHNSGGGRDALLRNIYLRQDGLYSLLVESGGGPGVYALRLTSGPQPIPVTPTIPVPPTVTPFREVPTPAPVTAVPDGVLEPYQPVIGSLQRRGAVNRHFIGVRQGDSISIGVREMQPEARLRLIIEVYNPSGELVSQTSSSSSGDALLQLPPALEGGAYSIFVTGENRGDYQIAFGYGAIYAENLRGPALADTPYDGQLAQRGVQDVWTLALSAGDRIALSASPTNGTLDPVLELFAPDGSLVASDDNGGGYPNALINEAQAPQTGLYRLAVSAAGGSSIGSYRLIWRYVAAAPTPTFDPPHILLFTVEDAVLEGAYAFYPFQGAAGQRVRVRVIGTGFDPVAVLIGPDGQEIASGDDEDGLNPLFSAELPADGTYQVRINGYLSGGAFTLVVERLF